MIKTGGGIHADRFVQSSVPSVNVQQLPVPSLKERNGRRFSWSFSEVVGIRCNHQARKSLFALSKNFEKKGLTGLSNGEKNFLENSILFSDFESNKIPEGWNISGEAFKPRGHNLISLNDANTLPKRNVLSSNILGSKRVGNLRSPLFKVEHDQILIRANEENFL